MSRHRAAREPGWVTTLAGHAAGVSMIAGRIVAMAVALAVFVVTGVGWWLAGSASSSDALNDAGDVGVVQPPGASASVAGGADETAPPASTAAPATTARDPDPFGAGENILVVGIDSRSDAEGNPLTPEQQRLLGVTLDGGSVNTDTLLIVHIPGDGRRITGISIPRDTWMGLDVVHAPGMTGPDSSGGQVPYRPGKINGFYSTAKYYRSQYLQSQGVTGAELNRESDEAGRTMLIKVIQQFTGIKIDHYAEANLLGFYLMSQAIGGVPVCLVHPVDDPKSGAHFPAGEFSVEGRDALAFVRQRHGLRGSDLARITRQQVFLESAANKVLSTGTLANPGRLAALVDAVQHSLVLDRDFDLLTFAEQLQGLVAGSLHFVTLPTTPATDITTTDALRADPAQVRKIFSALDEGRPLPAAAATSASSAPRVSGAGGDTGAATPATTSATSPDGGSDGPSGYQVPCVA